jgi:hypothetical protein
MRSNTCGGGPSIDSNATVAPPPDWANAPPPPLLAQPPSPHPNRTSAAAIAAVGRREAVRDSGIMVSFVTPERYR